jgi:hypothetical protein
LVIETDPNNNKVKVLNNPPFTRPTFVKLDVIYELEYSSELDSSIGFGGTVLDAIELRNIIAKLDAFCGSHQFINACYDCSQIKHHNPRLR